MSETVKHHRICLVVNFTPEFPYDQMPREIDQEQLREQLENALQPDSGADFKIFGSRGGFFEQVPEGYTYEQAQESFDQHVIELLFGERLERMAQSPQGRLALLAVVQQANAAAEENSGAILTEVDSDQPTRQ